MLMVHPHTKQWQSLTVCDITKTRPDLPEVDFVYSDPPWNPGNEKYWRTHAKTGESSGYDAFLMAWCRVVVAFNPSKVLVEQSANWEHANQLIAATAMCDGWRWPLLEHWQIEYSRPARPNRLLHFGWRRLATDPSGMTGEKMTLRVFDGLPLHPGMTVGDPCMGKGTTSRVAHHYGLNCVGTEMNPTRLEVTISWLLRRGYEVQSG